MKIYAIRHTSVKVDPGICYGQTDVSVSDSFENEKQKSAQELNGITFDKIYSSPLFRCRLLAENLFQEETIVYDDRLKELNFGEWEMKSWDDIYTDSKGKIWMDNYQTLPAPGGESYPEMIKRIQEFVEDMKLEKSVQVALVAHAGVIRILKSLIDNVSIAYLFEHFKPGYGSVTIFEIRENE